MQVSAAGDMCAICQEKMQAPILLSCKHMFCEECVSEWSVLNSLFGKLKAYYIVKRTELKDCNSR